MMKSFAIIKYLMHVSYIAESQFLFISRPIHFLWQWEKGNRQKKIDDDNEISS